MPRLADRTTESRIIAENSDRLIHEYKPFILRTASFVLKRYVSDSDDAWSVALIAFWEAADHYNPDKGGFENYAQMVIKRRLIDYQRKQLKFQPEIDVAPETFSGDTEREESSFYPQLALMNHSAAQNTGNLKDELDGASELLLVYGFDFMDLVSCSPKSAKTKSACLKAVACMLKTPELIAKLRHTRRLPVAALSVRTHVTLKLLNRHRRYIVAVVEILNGDFPELAAYLDFYRKG